MLVFKKEKKMTPKRYVYILTLKKERGLSMHRGLYFAVLKIVSITMETAQKYNIRKF